MGERTGGRSLRGQRRFVACGRRVFCLLRLLLLLFGEVKHRADALQGGGVGEWGRRAILLDAWYWEWRARTILMNGDGCAWTAHTEIYGGAYIEVGR